MARKSRKQPVVDAIAPVQEDTGLFRVAVYLRLSADDARKKGDSLENQRNIIERYIAGQPDLQLAQTYTDNDKTGTNFNRPAFQEMLADIEAGKINCVIVKDLSRFGRNAIDAGYYLERYFPEKKVRFIAVTDGHDSQESDGGILLPIKNILAEGYALDIGRKCKAVQRQKMLDGKFIGGRAPYGYKKDASTPGKLIVDEATACYVREAFALAEQGESYFAIARYFNYRNIPTASEYKKAQGAITDSSLVGRGNWTRRAIADMLHDCVYTGDLVQGKTRKLNGKQIYTSPESWIVVKNTHEALVDKAVFAILRQNASESKRIYRKKEGAMVPYSANLLAGKTVCAHCGYAMARKRENRDGAYWYRCESQQNYGKQACTVVSAKERDILHVLLATFFQQIKVMTGHYQALCIAQERGSEGEELAVTRQEIAKTKRLVQSLYENLISDVITAEEYGQLKAEYTQRAQELAQRAGDLQEAMHQRQASIRSYESLQEAIDATLQNREVTALLMERLVERVEVHPDKTATIHLKYRSELQEVG